MKNYLCKNLVFEGGGVKGIAYAGALKILEKKKIIDTVENVAGTSAGAITATLVALDFTSKEIKNILAQTNFADFKDSSPFILPNLIRLYKNFGWFKGKKFENWFAKIIAQKINPNATFSQLKNRELFIIGANLNSQKEEIFSKKTTPNMTIVKAVRISMSIPIFFQAIKTNGKTYVDGGTYYNYPINLFDKNTPNEKTLGLRVDSSDELFKTKKKENITSLKSYTKILIESLIELTNKRHLRDEDWNRTIYINTGDIKATQFELSRKEIDTLVKAGEEGAKKYFQWLERKN